MINLYNEDCMEGMKRYPDNHFELAIVDPPYGLQGGLQDISSSFRIRDKRRPEHDTKYTKGISKLSGSGKLKNRILNQDKCEWDSNSPSTEYFDLIFTKSKNQIIWGGNYFNLPPCRGFAIWDKEQPWENFSACEFAWGSFDMPSKMFRLCTFRTGEKKIHPTQKPVKLYEWLLKNYAKEGDKILDTHGGSMSIALACHNMNFDLDLYEIDKDYFEAGKARLEEHQKQQIMY